MPPPKAMGEAFDAACKAMHDSGQPTAVDEVMARRRPAGDLPIVDEAAPLGFRRRPGPGATRIIATARKGERDVWQLCRAVAACPFAAICALMWLRL